MIWFSKSYSRIWVLIADILFCLFSIVFAYSLRFNFSIPPDRIAELPYIISFVLLVRGISFWISKTYTSMMRFTTTQDVGQIFLVLSWGSVIFILSNFLKFYFFDGNFIIPISIIIVDFFITGFLLTTFRLIVKTLYTEYAYTGKSIVNVAIYGAGEAGIITKEALDRDAEMTYNVLAFIDDDPAKMRKKLEGITIIGSDKIEELLSKNNISILILAIQNLDVKKKQRIIELALKYNTRILNVPPVSQWINGQLSFKQIKKVNIEDLLEREEIKIYHNQLANDLKKKTIMITGAAGSIGSELANQIIDHEFKRLILIDQAETALFHLEAEYAKHINFNKTEFIVGDICNEARMQRIFELYRPDFVFHSAAYKHVPVMEINPAEAVDTNINGTKILADLSSEYGVDKFVMISTDKAVRPTNVMGASKRIAEIYVQALNQHSRTKFITTRFGNVLGSNGSVILLFNKQIEKGGPLTITHPEVTRYFMTIPEACQLVLEAGTMGKGGEVFIFDMGESIKIIDLATKMIKLSGLEIGKDIQIKYTGLRPGEKLYEELLFEQESTIPTHHPKIMIAKVEENELGVITKNINELISKMEVSDDLEIVKKMKEIVPSFISKNSRFEELDVDRA